MSDLNLREAHLAMQIMQRLVDEGWRSWPALVAAHEIVEAERDEVEQRRAAA